MKKILIFSLTYQPFVGGAEVAIAEITKRISEKEFEFDMVTLCFNSLLPRHEKIGNVNVYRVGFGTKNPTAKDLVSFPLAINKYLFPFLALRKASKLYQKNYYDATWSMMANYAGFAALFFKMKKPAVPFLLTLQEGDPIDYIKHRVRFVYPLFERIFLKANFVQTISHYLADFARDMGFQGRLEVIPNGVDYKNFQMQVSKTELIELRQELGIKTIEKVLITTSRLVPKNGVGDIIQSLTFLSKDIKLLILGIGPLEVELKQKVKDLKLEARVLFLGQVDYKEIPKYLQISNIFVRPSLSEGMGNSFIEAMASGIPVIATPVGGIPDFLFDPEQNPDKKPTGLFCEVGNPRSIAYRVEMILGDKQLSERLVENASQMVSTKYDWDLIVSKMKEKVFSQVTK